MSIDKLNVGKVVIAALIALFLPVNSLGARTGDLELLRRADSLASFLDADFSAQYTIDQIRPGRSTNRTVAGVFRRDVSDTYVIVVMEPVINRGQGYLKQGATLWFFDPESRRFNSTSSQARFQNTNARNSDFTRSTLAEDYQIISGVYEMLGNLRCRVLDLEAITNDMTFPRMRIWISEDGLVRKTQDFSLSGQLMRTSLITDYWRIGNRFVPRQIVVADALRGAWIDGRFVQERTVINIERPSFRDLPDITFSKAFLESVNR